MHPRIACAIFAVICLIIGFLVRIIFKINIFEHVLTYVIVLVLSGLVYKYFADRYDGDRSV